MLGDLQMSRFLIVFSLQKMISMEETWNIEFGDSFVNIQAGNLKRRISIKKDSLYTTKFTVGGQKIANYSKAPVNDEFKFAIHQAVPNERPKGITLEEAGVVIQKNEDIGGTDGLSVDSSKFKKPKQNVDWEMIATVSGRGFNGEKSISASRIECALVKTEIEKTKTLKLSLAFEKSYIPQLCGIQVAIYYQIYEDWPAIRKWIEISNLSEYWLKIDNLWLDNIDLTKNLPKFTELTPSERGASASIVAFSDKEMETGVILGSEIPSAIRKITKEGQVCYEFKNFEWVLGPKEKFTSEEMFYYAFQGESWKTVSSISTPLDRAIEDDFQRFLEQIVGIRANPENVPVPLWCSWSNFVANINDQIIRDQAELAAKCGFTGFQIDAGWSESENDSDWTCGSRVPHSKKFPHFEETCKYVRDQGLELGLWLSCYRNRQSPDLEDLPNAMSLPLFTRGEGIAMSFASDWREYFARDVLTLHEKYGAVYFKQDLTNMKFGDIAEGHESRTKKESLLRAIRGFLRSQDIIAENAPDVCTLLSHEIYWGTPGVPCDIAAMKHCWTFHIPPNDYSGCGNRRKQISEQKTGRFSPLKFLLRLGCYHSRKRYYEHRGLPLYCIEYYGAATVNIGGSLTPKIQDRQICSWLMGAPTVYAGDLYSLTQENIAHYRKRLDLVKSLQQKYGIYRYFQYSGVPEPTDLDWHWWGKINQEQSGVVVVVRGYLGRKFKRINIPWVDANAEYEVLACFKEKSLGKYSGKQLQNGILKIALPRLGQEILEIKKS